MVLKDRVKYFRNFKDIIPFISHSVYINNFSKVLNSKSNKKLLTILSELCFKEENFLSKIESNNEKEYIKSVVIKSDSFKKVMTKIGIS